MRVTTRLDLVGLVLKRDAAGKYCDLIKDGENENIEEESEKRSPPDQTVGKITTKNF